MRFQSLLDKLRPVTRLAVRASTITIRPDNHGRCEDQWVEQRLMRETLINGLVVRAVELDREDVPSYAWIEAATLGSTDWKSKFAKLGSFGRDGIFTPHAIQETAH